MDEIDKILKDLRIERKLKKASGHPSIEYYKCAKCQDAGILHPVEYGEVDYSRTIECECRREENRRLRILQLTKMCELPKWANGFTFDNFKARPGLEKAYKLAKQLANGEGLKWLTLVGDVDVGKTHLAIAICREWLSRGMPAKYAYVPLLLDELRRGYHMQGEDAFDYRFKIYCMVPLLILDDLGAENGTDWAREKLDTIVDTRVINGLAMVVTTNLGMDELPRRIASRLQRVTFGEVIYIDAKEYRIYKTKAT
jgi:DNA replication protein DnaC